MDEKELTMAGGRANDDNPRSSRPSARVRLPRPIREQQMLEAATLTFAELGYHKTSMDQIAERVGISKPMLYSYFESKEGLYIACLRRSGGDMISRVIGAVDPDSGPERALWEGFLTFFAFIRERPQDWQLVRVDSVQDSPGPSEVVQQIHDEFRSMISALSEVASKDTPGDPFADAERREAASHALFGAAASLGNRWLEAGASTPVEQTCTELMNFFWIGYGGLAEGELWSTARLDA